MIDFAVGHGCEGSPTTAVAIQIPEGVTSVQPTVVPGWTIDIANETLATPVDNGHGGQITERTASVTYTATGEPLSDSFRQVFSVSMKVPEGAGETLAFPVVQTCLEGETPWITVPKEGEAEPEHPAPVIVLAAATGDGHGHGGGDSAENGTENGTENGARTATNNDDDSDGGSSNGLAAAAFVRGVSTRCRVAARRPRRRAATAASVTHAPPPRTCVVDPLASRAATPARR